MLPRLIATRDNEKGFYMSEDSSRKMPDEVVVPSEGISEIRVKLGADDYVKELAFLSGGKTLFLSKTKGE